MLLRRRYQLLLCTTVIAACQATRPPPATPNKAPVPPVGTSPRALASLPSSARRSLMVGAGKICVLDGDVVWCRDYDGGGEDRPIHYSPRRKPQSLPAAFRAMAIAVGTDHACALSREGTVACWGSNQQRQLGLDSATTESAGGVTVSGVTDATSIVAGNGFACSLHGNGAVRCWGDSDGNYNIQGRYLWLAHCNERLATDEHASCSDLETLEQQQPATTDGAVAQVPLLTRATALSAGDSYACALLVDKRVMCWGQGFGQNHKD